MKKNRRIAVVAVAFNISVSNQKQSKHVPLRRNVEALASGGNRKKYPEHQ